MSLLSENMREAYAGNGITTSFSFPFAFHDATDLDVYLVSSVGVETKKAFVSDYDVVGNFNPLTGENDDFTTGANVVFVVAPASGVTVVILRNVPDTQDLSLPQNTAYPPTSIEFQFDKIAMMVQYLKDRSDRSVRISDANPQSFSGVIPGPLLANNFLVVDPTASFITQSASGGGGGGGGAWLTITGTLSDQTDLNSALALKAPIANPTFTGTTTGTFSGNITGNVTGNVTGSSGSTTGNAATVTTNANLTGDVTSSGNATTVVKINGTSLSGLATGILKNTTTTGVPSIAVAGDFPTLNQNTSGTAANVTTNANLTGPVTSTGNSTAIANGAITNAMLANAAVANLTNTNSGDITVAAFGSAPTANAASLSGQALTIQPADGTHPGAIAVAAQTMGSGIKTFSSNPVFSAMVTGGVLLNDTSGNITSSAGALAVAKGGTAVASVTTTPTASSFAGWDANSNLSANNFIAGFATTATAAGTTTMTVADKELQVWTGSSTQTVKLPTTSIVAGAQYVIVNLSSGNVTIQSSGANAITTMSTNTQGVFTALVATPTTAANWSATYQALTPAGAGLTNPMTTTGDIIYSSDNSGTPARLGIGSTNQALTVSGGLPAWTGGATLGYAQAYFSDPTAQWSTTSASFADLTLGFGASTLTVRQSSGITLTAAGSNLPGITFTPSFASAVYLVTANLGAFSTGASSNDVCQLISGATVIATNPGFEQQVGGSNVFVPQLLSGIYIPGTTSPVTIKIQALTSGTYFLEALTTGGTAVEWTVIQLPQNSISSVSSSLIGGMTTYGIYY